jgi:hypothetical protein
MLKQACKAFSRKKPSLSTIAFTANFQQNRNRNPASFLQILRAKTEILPF